MFNEHNNFEVSAITCYNDAKYRNCGRLRWLGVTEL